MENSLLKNTKISEYLELLREGSDTQRIKEIDTLLSSRVSGGGGVDLQLFQMQKDYMLFQCKYVLALNDFNSAKMELYANRMTALMEKIQKKIETTAKHDLYGAFIQWLLVLKKYYGSDIDKSNDLLYLVEATNSMMKWYGAQNEAIEQQKSKQRK